MGRPFRQLVAANSSHWYQDNLNRLSGKSYWFDWTYKVFGDGQPGNGMPLPFYPKTAPSKQWSIFQMQFLNRIYRFVLILMVALAITTGGRAQTNYGAVRGLPKTFRER